MTRITNPKVGRNDPCPCGSGMKWKKCCGPRLNDLPPQLIPIMMGPSARDPNKEEAVEIRTSEEIKPYIDTVLGTFRIFDLPRIPALLHCLRAIHSQHVGGLGLASGVLPDIPPRQFYRRMRDAQDLLRYLVYEIFSRCRGLGSVGPSSIEQIKLGSATVDEFSKLSEIRDAVVAERRGWATCEVNRAQRLVRIDDPPEGLRHVGLRQERFAELLEESARNFECPDARILNRLFSSVRPLSDRSYSLRLDEEIVSSFLPEAENIWRSSGTAPLPEHWMVGPYSIGDFRRFFLLLATWVNIHMTVLAKISAEGFVPWNTSVPVVSSRELVEVFALHGSLPEELVREIVRDLTYNHKEVPWTDTQYQPLIPLTNDSFALPPLIISGSNFERNLLALVDRLPWRMGTAEDLQRHRESHMIEELREVVRRLPLGYKDRIPLRSNGEEIGDIDFLIWGATGDKALAIELKWFYGPDSVHETWVHANRYEVAVRKHLRTVSFLQEELHRIVQDYGIKGLGTDARVTPVLVTKQDEPPQHLISGGVPVVPMGTFIKMLNNSGGSLDALTDALDSYQRREPTKRTRARHKRLRFGSYYFDIPEVVVKG